MARVSYQLQQPGFVDIASLQLRQRAMAQQQQELRKQQMIKSIMDIAAVIQGQQQKKAGKQKISELEKAGGLQKKIVIGPDGQIQTTFESPSQQFPMWGNMMGGMPYGMGGYPMGGQGGATDFKGLYGLE
jgi:hypothetical protein